MPDYAKSIAIGSITIFGILILFGCNSTGGSADFRVSETQQAKNRQPADALSDAPLAMVDDVAIHVADLRPTLFELAGAEAFGERLLDIRLDSLARARGIKVTTDDIATERQRLLQTLSPDANEAQRLLDALRARQGLGPTRFDALLRRNALLRALVQSDVIVDDAAAQRTFELLHGQRHQPRLIVVNNLNTAQQVKSDIQDGQSFAEVAMQRSTDESAARGGLLAPISHVDPTYPKVIRDALLTLNVGEVSQPIMIPNGFAVLKLESIIPTDAITFDSVRDDMVEQTRRNVERIEMERLAQKLISEASIQIYDAGLNDVWQERIR